MGIDTAHPRFSARIRAVLAVAGGTFSGAWGQVGDRVVLATGGGDGSVRVWDPWPADPTVAVLPGQTHMALWEAWGQVGGRAVLAAGGVQDGSVRVWDPSAADPVVAVLPVPTGDIMWGAWGQVGERAVLASGGGVSVRVWDPFAADPLVALLPDHTDWGAWAQVGDRAVLATGGKGGSVRVWDPFAADPELTMLAELPGYTGYTGFGFRDWGTWAQVGDRAVLATGGKGGSVRVWDPFAADPELAVLAELPGYTGDNGLGLRQWGAWAQVGDRAVLATGGGDDGSVRVWDPFAADPELAVLAELPGYTGDNGLGLRQWGAWAQVGDRAVLATGGGDDGSVRVWEPLAADPVVAVLPALSGGLWGAWAQVGSKAVLATGHNLSVLVWELVQLEPVQRLPSIRSDAREAAGAIDLLGRTVESTALADVITARSARPPLAIGLFGQWGEGKSLFLEMIQHQVKVRAAEAGRHDPITHGAVRQVRFNAWHYAETDLWAGLVAELFSQLQDQSNNPGRAQRERSRLTTELVDARHIQQQRVSAKARLEDLRHVQQGITQGLWDRLPLATRQRARVLLGDHPERLDAEILAAAGHTRSVGQTGLMLLRRMPWWAWLLGALGAAGFVAFVVWGPALAGWIHSLPLVISAVALATGGANAWAKTATSRAAISKAWSTARKFLDEEADRLDTAVRVAEAEVDQLDTQLQNLTAAGQLAGIVQERHTAGSYRERLGLMTEIRQDFERMATLLRAAAGTPTADDAKDAVGDQLPAIDRIVLYIDDLDRCPPDRVVEVLEAIHLMLAVELFVVVVAVDPTWLLNALATHYRDLFRRPTTSAADAAPTGDEQVAGELAATGPAQYLEKIFQIVLTIPAMDDNGYRLLVHDVLGRRSNVGVLSSDGTLTGAIRSTTTTTVRAAALTLSATTSPVANMTDWWVKKVPSYQLGDLRVVQRIDPLALTEDEHRLIEVYGPPLLATPRSVKRFANSYGLLTAIETAQAGSNERPSLQPVQDLVHLPDGRHFNYSYRAAMTLLAAVIAYPALGPEWLPNLYAAIQQGNIPTWIGYLAETKERLTKRKLNDPTGQWAAMISALEQAGKRAAAMGLALPEKLSIWEPWIVPVGRLSFPSGSAVARLHRTPPTSTASTADEFFGSADLQ